MKTSLTATSPTPGRQIIYLPGYVSPSLNKIVGRNWTSLNDMKRKAQKALAFARGAAPLRGPYDGTSRILVRFTRFACRLVDFDNGAGGVKYICDALRYLQFIPDDDPATIDFQFRQVRVQRRADEGMLIEIETTKQPFL